MKKIYIYCLIIIVFIIILGIEIFLFTRNKFRDGEIILVKEFATNQKCVNIDSNVVNIFYEDDNNEYYYYCLKSYEYKIKYRGNYYSLSDAIDNNIVSIDNLDNIGLNYNIIKKNTPIEDNTIIDDNIEGNKVNTDITQDKNNNQIKIVDKSSGECLQVIDYFYEDNNYKYYFNCYKSGSIYVIISGNEYLLKEALNNNIVTISELEKNGIKFNKEAKYQSN